MRRDYDWVFHTVINCIVCGSDKEKQMVISCGEDADVGILGRYAVCAGRLVATFLRRSCLRI